MCGVSVVVFVCGVCGLVCFLCACVVCVFGMVCVCVGCSVCVMYVCGVCVVFVCVFCLWGLVACVCVFVGFMCGGCVNSTANYVHNTCGKNDVSCFPTHSQFMTSSSQ